MAPDHEEKSRLETPAARRREELKAIVQLYSCIGPLEKARAIEQISMLRNCGIQIDPESIGSPVIYDYVKMQPVEGTEAQQIAKLRELWRTPDESDVLNQLRFLLHRSEEAEDTVVVEACMRLLAEGDVSVKEGEVKTPQDEQDKSAMNGTESQDKGAMNGTEPQDKSAMNGIEPKDKNAMNGIEPKRDLS